MMDNTIFFRYFDTLKPIWKTFRHILLQKSFFVDSGREAFHRDGAPDDMRQHQRRNHRVVGGEFTFRNPVIGEQDFFGMSNHHVSLTTSRGDLSERMPTNRGCRSLLLSVHSMKATCTTISGCTQCARMRGSPTAFVNGDFGISSLSRRARSSSNSFVSKPVPTLPAKTKSFWSK